MHFGSSLANVAAFAMPTTLPPAAWQYQNGTSVYDHCSSQLLVVLKCHVVPDED